MYILPLPAIVANIVNHAFSLQEAMDEVLKNPSLYKPGIRDLALNHPTGIVRLWSFWALAEMQDTDSLQLLQKAYFTEPHPEARVNIVWALFVIDPSCISVALLRAFMHDEHFAVPMLCARYIHGLPWLENQINFVESYRNHSQLVRIELLKNIRSFAYDPRTINLFLAAELNRPYDRLFTSHIMCAIAYTNQISSADILLRHYHASRRDFYQDEVLALQLANIARYLGRAKIYNTLHEIYTMHQSPTVRSRIKEALDGGGSCCDHILHNINQQVGTRT